MFKPYYAFQCLHCRINRVMSTPISLIADHNVVCIYQLGQGRLSLVKLRLLIFEVGVS